MPSDGIWPYRATSSRGVEAYGIAALFQAELMERLPIGAVWPDAAPPLLYRFLQLVGHAS